MIRIKLKYYLFFLGLLLIIACKSTNNKNIPLAEKGLIDLSACNFDNSSTIKLDGEWEFYWNRLINPEDFCKDSFNIKNESNTFYSQEYIKLPRIWDGLVIDNKSLPTFGYATFRLKIKTPKELKQFGIQTGRIESAYKIIVNGKTIITAGQVGKTREETVSKRLKLDGYFCTDTTIQEIIIQISNFRARISGVFESIIIGNPKKISDESKQKIAFDIFIIGILLIIGFYHFGLFFARRDDLPSHYFALVCTLTAIYYSTNSAFFTETFYQALDWELLMKIDYFPDYMRVPCFAFFIYKLFKEEVSKFFVFFITIFISILTFFTIITPARIYTYSLIWFEIITLITILYLLYGLYKASITKRDGAIYTFIATLILLLTAIHDVLYENMLISSRYLSPFGLFIYIFFQSFALSLRFSKLYKSETALTKRLSALSEIKDKFIGFTSHKLKEPLFVLQKNINATKGFFILKQNEEWVIRGAVTTDESINIIPSFTELNAITEKKRSLAPISIINYVLENKEIVVLKNATQSQFQNDDYIKLNKICSIICFPLIKNEELIGLLYFENQFKENVFDEEKQKVIDLLISHILVIIDNSNIFAQLKELNIQLEEKVKIRTQEVEEQKEELRAKADELNKANRILMERQEEIQQQSEELEVQAETLQKINKTLENQNEMIKHQNILITGSISYALTIQEAILPSKQEIDRYFDSFIIYKPKDIVSGDFYWFTTIENKILNVDDENEIENRIMNHYIAVVDCTGHGVPGAFMSLIGNRLLNEIIFDKKIYAPNDILSLMNNLIIKDLKQEMTESKDGMDVCLCKIQKISKNEYNLVFSGAKRDLFIHRKNTDSMHILRGERRTVGGLNNYSRLIKFTNQNINLSSGDTIYLTTDGFVDQSNNVRQRFGSKHLQQILLENKNLSMPQQKQILENALEEWKTGEFQRDDITLLGIRLR